MRSTKLAIGLALLLGAAYLPPAFAHEESTRPANQPSAAYVCPMCHTTSDKPGKCPQCGMEMQKNKDMKHARSPATQPAEAKSDTEDMDD